MSLAGILLFLSRWIAPAERSNWLQAMEAEYEALEAGRIPWALGCLAVSLRLRFVKDGLYLTLLGAGIWVLCMPHFMAPLNSAIIEIIPKEYLNIGLYPHPIYSAFVCFLLGAYRPKLIVLSSICVVVAHQLNGFYTLYVQFPKIFDYEQEQSFWEFLQSYRLYDAKPLIGTWAALGASLTGGLLGRAVAGIRFRRAG